VISNPPPPQTVVAPPPRATHAPFTNTQPSALSRTGPDVPLAPAVAVGAAVLAVGAGLVAASHRNRAPEERQESSTAE
jgi:hypothetical protein